MFEVQVERTFSAAHHLLNYNGKCERPHGHNWVVRAWARGDRLDEANMFIDYGIMKRELDNILAQLDHTDLNENPLIGQGISPSSEFLARLIYQHMKAAIPEVYKVCIFETPIQCAYYYETE
ncbi:MAG: 6-carboxytetrahydropterin synthase [Candidatus Melainabacteria bacterium]|nr:6-carboxytetrahydropterin synthase [Candidatus Melainabacteria bacterium]